MSTRIYNGLLIDFSGSMSALRLAIIKLAKEVMLPAADKEMHKVYAALALTNRDKESWSKRIMSSPTTTLSESYDQAIKIVRDRVDDMQDKRSRDPVVDFEFSITLFPLKHKILAIPFVDNPILLNLLKQQSYVKEYGYWNNTDQPDDISGKDWKIRGADWDEALMGSGIPSENGFTIQLIQPGYLAAFSQAIAEANAPSVNDRIEALFNDELSRIIDTQFELIFPTSDSKSYYQFSQHWRSSEAGLLVIANLRDSIEQHINSNDHWPNNPKLRLT